MTQWVGEAWESIHKELQLTIQPSAELPLLLMDLKMIKSIFAAWTTIKFPGASEARRPPDSDVAHSNSGSNDSDASEASGSGSVVSFEQVIID